MTILRNALPFAAALATAMAGCVAGIDGPGNTGDDDDPTPTNPNPTRPTQPPPPPPPPVATAAIYKRGSLAPQYELTPRGKYGDFTQKGVQMADSDFVALGNGFTPQFEKLAEISQQISTERGGVAAPIVTPADADRARRMPFRGNPTDIKIFKDGNTRKAYIPLGGGVSAPGNEVEVVDLDSGETDQINVGIRPQRVAIAGGLVFVVNQYSNYISIINPLEDELLQGSDGNPVEIETEYYGTDIIVVPKSPGSQDDENFWLFVANNWRASVLQYGIRIVKGGLNDEVTDVIVTDPGTRDPANQPFREITGLGRNPYRLTLSQDQRSVYVANNRGGEAGLLTIATGATKRVKFTSHTGEITQVNDKIFIPTGPAFRGFPFEDDTKNIQTFAPPVRVNVDGEQLVVHPGAQYDGTKAYNFEDVRNGLYQLDSNLDTNNLVYFTDDITPEEEFDEAEKILTGASATQMIVNAARNKAWIIHSGNDLIQTVSIRNGQFRLADANQNMETEERPWAAALDEQNGELVVVNWGGESVQRFNINNGQEIGQEIGLKYAALGAAAYPATNMERGEFFFYNTQHSNNGRKACAVGCHWDELLIDGIPYGNGATGNTQPHQVTPNFNQATTGSFFWNGSFKNGSYASLASDAQARTNCELIAFGLIEGSASPPAVRVGDPANRITNGNDAQCRPDTSGPGVLPVNFDTILAVSAQQKIVRNQLFIDVTGLPFDDVTRLTDFYSAYQLRLPPNPVAYLYQAEELPSALTASIDRGKDVFERAACGGCHDPLNNFVDGKEHGAGSTWRERFIAEYDNNPKLLNILPTGIPDAMKVALSGSSADKEINVHVDPIAYFSPFCFDVNECLVFEDPLAAKGNNALEIERLEALVLVNLANADREFVPGQVRGQPAVNTPSLRGKWWTNVFLNHGFANSLNEAILAPGHPALREGELGYAMDRFGNTDVHGLTEQLTAQDVDDLYAYLTSIE